MGEYQITGGRPLAGQLRVQGAKNSVLPILAATVLAAGIYTIHNCPDLRDVSATMEILRLLGCSALREGDTVQVDTTCLRDTYIPAGLMGELRSSVVFLGGLLGRCGGARMSYPGGCELGPRPIDLHLSALRGLGARIVEGGGRLECQCPRGLVGRELCLPIPSVGATENAMLAACAAEGVTTIVGAAREPEIEDLQNFLQTMGADVRGAGSTVIRITGGRPLHGAEYTVMGDRMAAATYLCCVSAAGGCVRLNGVEPSHLSAVLSVLEEGGADVSTAPDEISITCAAPLCGVRPIRTAPHPGFPTDAQAPVMAALSCGTGTTMMVENMFSSRFGHVGELCRMGAEIQVDGRVAVVTGRPLCAAGVRGTDLRGSAALVAAALGAKGVSRVSGVEHIRRGYHGLERDLRSLGAAIELV